MITEFDVYAAFRRAQANTNDRGYRLPKDWTTFRDKMAKLNGEQLYKMTMYFNTTYVNVNLDEYMTCGFELWKGFTYKNFCDRRVLELYIQRDKIKKRRLSSTKEEIDNSFEYIRLYLSNKPQRPGYTQLQNFCKFRDGEVRNIINMYNRGQVDSMTLVYCMNRRYLSPTDDERILIPYITQRFRELQETVRQVTEYVSTKERQLDERTREETVS